MPDDFLRPAQLAVRLHVSPKTVARWINEGLIAHTRTLGGSIGRGHARISEQEARRLEELMSEGLKPREAAEAQP